MQRYVSFCTECVDEPSAKHNRARRALQAGDPRRDAPAAGRRGCPPNLALRSFAHHLRALNRSDNIVASYLDGVLQAEALLAARGQATIVPEQAVPIVLEEGLLAVCADKGTAG